MLRDPPHPGETLRQDVLMPLSLGVGEASVFLNVSRSALARVLNGRGRIAADLALRLEKAGFGTARFWMTLQTNYDLAQAMKHPF
jgi:addiction module HigA family antidote